MRIGIVGLPQSGKKTLFGLLTGRRPVETAPARGKGEFPVGVSSVPDARVDKLSGVYGPKRTRYAEIEWVLFPAMPKEAKARQEWLDAVRMLDEPAAGVCCLARAFTDESVYHEDGSVDPSRDLEKLDLEFAFADLALIETRLERLAKETSKKAAAEREKQEKLLERFRGELEAGHPLRGLFTGAAHGDGPALTEADAARLSGLKFLTRAGTVIALNVDEDIASDEERAAEAVSSLHPSARKGREVVVFSAKLEAELAELDDPAERREFVEQFGIGESVSVKLAKAALGTLGQMSFLTANRNEVRAWLVRRGATAPEAAGVVHTDFEQGFIRAEVMDVDELLAAGSEARLREQGKVALGGRDYVVKDGDVLHILGSYT